MSYPDWASLRAHLVDRFDGELPHPQTEQEIIDAYEQHPDAVERAANQVATDFANGAIRSGWGVLRHRAASIRNPPSNPTANTGRAAEKRLERAAQWIRNAGLHCISWNDCHESLTEDLHLTEDQAASLQPLYDEQAPIGRQLEADAIERAQRWKQSQARLAELEQQKRAELDAIQEAART